MESIFVAMFTYVWIQPFNCRRFATSNMYNCIFPIFVYYRLKYGFRHFFLVNVVPAIRAGKVTFVSNEYRDPSYCWILVMLYSCNGFIYSSVKIVPIK